MTIRQIRKNVPLWDVRTDPRETRDTQEPLCRCLRVLVGRLLPTPYFDDLYCTSLEVHTHTSRLTWFPMVPPLFPRDSNLAIFRSHTNNKRKIITYFTRKQTDSDSRSKYGDCNLIFICYQNFSIYSTIYPFVMCLYKYVTSTLIYLLDLLFY